MPKNSGSGILTPAKSLILFKGCQGCHIARSFLRFRPRFWHPLGVLSAAPGSSGIINTSHPTLHLHPTPSPPGLRGPRAAVRPPPGTTTPAQRHGVWGRSGGCRVHASRPPAPFKFSARLSVTGPSHFRAGTHRGMGETAPRPRGRGNWSDDQLSQSTNQVRPPSPRRGLLWCRTVTEPIRYGAETINASCKCFATAIAQARPILNHSV